jgi:hypothetical protein
MNEDLRENQSSAAIAPGRRGSVKTRALPLLLRIATAPSWQEGFAAAEQGSTEIADQLTQVRDARTVRAKLLACRIIAQRCDNAGQTAAKLFRDAMRAAMGSSIPDDFWEYSN